MPGADWSFPGACAHIYACLHLSSSLLDFLHMLVLRGAWSSVLAPNASVAELFVGNVCCFGKPDHRCLLAGSEHAEERGDF